MSSKSKHQNCSKSTAIDLGANKKQLPSHNRRPSHNSRRINDSANCQLQRILHHFETVSCRLTVTEGRNKLGVMSLSRRIRDLRERGLNILTIREVEHDNLGLPHRNGVYVFLGRKK